jgi:hypothetical protein
MFKLLKEMFGTKPSPFEGLTPPNQTPNPQPETPATVIDIDVSPTEKKPAAKRRKKKAGDTSVEKTAKEIATENGEPYVAVLSVEVDPENVHDGAFELDWNDKFITNLVRAGYQGKTDADIVDRWFQDVCRNIVLENFEQWDANYATQRRVDRQDMGNGKTSVS